MRSTTGRAARRACSEVSQQLEAGRCAGRRAVRSDRGDGATAARAITGSTARRTSITSSSCARRAAPRCRRASGPIRSSTRAAPTICSVPTDDVPVASEEFGIDLEAEVAVITDDVPMGRGGRGGRRSHPPADAGERLVAAQPDPGGARERASASTSRSPRPRSRRCAVTPDELGAAWDGGRVHLPLVSQINGQLVRSPGCRRRHDVRFPATDRARRRRRAGCGAGTIVGSGTVSNYDRSLRLVRASPSSACSSSWRARRAADAVPALRRPGPDRDARTPPGTVSSAPLTRRSCALPVRSRCARG